MFNYWDILLSLAIGFAAGITVWTKYGVYSPTHDREHKRIFSLVQDTSTGHFIATFPQNTSIPPTVGDTVLRTMEAAYQTMMEHGGEYHFYE